MDALLTDVQHAFKDIRRQLAEAQGGESLWTHVREFIAAIDWSERWIQAIVGAHAITLLAVITWRRNVAMQLCVFGCAAAVVFFAEPINALGADYWEEFAKQPYFDKRGAFYSGVISLPLVLIMMVIVVNLVSCTLSDVILLKREQALQRRRRAERTKEA